MSARLRAWFGSVAAAPQSTAEASDGALVSRYADTRDDDAFAELVRRHGPMVLATCKRVLYPDVHTADDAFQAAFLVLATRAGAVSPPERVGAWLHGVAVHVAKKARDWARRLAPSAPADLDRVPAADFAPDPDAPELRAKIDEVLAGLPLKYRAAVVLCDLEQRSRAEAAAALGWREGTLSGRLSRARKLLAERLVRRGVALGAAGLGVLVPASAARALVPAQLAASTQKAAALVAAGSAAGEAVPASVAELLRGVPAMHSSTFKFLAATAAGIGLALAGVGAYALTAADPPAPPVPAKPLAAAPAAPARGAGPKHTFEHKGAVTTVAVGTDFVASGDKDGVLEVWDTGTGQRRETLLDGTESAAKPIDRVAITADGLYLTLVTDGGAAYHLCTIAKEGRVFPGSGGQSVAIGCTHDGKWWAHVTGKRLVTLTENRLSENFISGLRGGQFTHADDITHAAIGDADLIATVAAGTLRRWDRADPKKPTWEVKLERFEPSVIEACALSRVIAVAGTNGDVRLYAGLTGKVLHTLKGHDGPVTAVAFSRDGTRVATGGADKTARVFDAETGKELAVLRGHKGPVSAVAFGPDADRLATGSADKAVRLWELKK